MHLPHSAAALQLHTTFQWGKGRDLSISYKPGLHTCAVYCSAADKKPFSSSGFFDSQQLAFISMKISV